MKKEIICDNSFMRGFGTVTRQERILNDLIKKVKTLTGESQKGK